MATGRLTWQNVAAPDFSGAVEAQRASALAFDNAMQRLGGAVQTFDNNRKDRADAAVLRNAMQYQNADELQAAIASGALMQDVNPDHVRVDALLKAQQQAGKLMELDKDRQQLATAQQTFEFNAANNPLRLEKSGLENTQLGNDITFTQDTRAREKEAREINQQVSNEWAEGFRTGGFQKPGAIAKWVQAAGPVNSPLAQARWQAAIKQVPALAQTFEQLGFATPAESPTNGLVGIGASGTGSFNVDTNKLFDSLLQTESAGRQFDNKGNVITSPKGAIGIAQVMPKTGPEAAKLAGLPWDETRFKQDAEYNKALGRAYFNKQLESFGNDPAKALAAYNAGPGALAAAVDKATKAGQPDSWLSYLPQETQAYVPNTLNRIGQATTPAARQDAGAAATQAQLAVVDAANREGVPQNQRYIKAMEMGVAGKEDTSLRGTLARHKDAFAGANQEQLEKLMREANQELGGGGNYELAAQFLLDENLSTGNFVANAWDKVFGDGGGRKFDADSVRSRIKDLKARGGFQLYNTAAAGYRANAALENQALSQQAVDDLIKRRDAATTAAQSGVQGAAEAAIMLDNQLTQARATQNAQSAATYDGFVPAGLKAPSPKAKPETPAVTPAQELTAQARAAAQVDPNSPAGKLQARNAEIRRIQETNAKERQRREQEQRREVAAQVESITPSVARTMSADQAREVMQNSAVFRRLPPNVQLLIERQATN